jgi:predicted choloylglycine hydrolase
MELLVDVMELIGTEYNIGVLQGEKLTLHSNIEKTKKLQENIDVAEAIRLLESISPHFLEELKGLADGLKIDLHEAMRLYSGYDLVLPPMGCSAYSSGEFYVRNYDFSPAVYDARFVFNQPENAYASVGFSEQILGRLDGMNEKGLVIGLHFVNSKHRKAGFLATTITRLVLDQCANVEEAIELIKTIPHGYSYNFSIMDGSGKNVVIEAAPDKIVLQEMKYLSCTNHFESDILRSHNRTEIDGSIKRKIYLQGLSKENLTPISAYHLFNKPDSPLFYKYYEQFFGTLHTVVYSPSDLSIIVGVGENCKAYQFSFTDWMENKLDLPDYLKGTIEF